jgi:dephospho-CoA kinase
VRDFLKKEIIERRMPINRDSMVIVANDLRRTYGASYITDCLYKQAVLQGGNAIIESIRAVGEIESLREKGAFILWAVDALPEVRYRRIVERASETDHISYETFLENEKREMVSTDSNKQNIAACMTLADMTLRNDGAVEEFYKEIDRVWGLSNIKG